MKFNKVIKTSLTILMALSVIYSCDNPSASGGSSIELTAEQQQTKDRFMVDIKSSYEDNEKTSNDSKKVAKSKGSFSAKALLDLESDSEADVSVTSIVKPVNTAVNTSLDLTSTVDISGLALIRTDVEVKASSVSESEDSDGNTVATISLSFDSKSNSDVRTNTYTETKSSEDTVLKAESSITATLSDRTMTYTKTEDYSESKAEIFLESNLSSGEKITINETRDISSETEAKGEATVKVMTKEDKEVEFKVNVEVDASGNVTIK